MPSRRSILVGVSGAIATAFMPAFAASPQPFNAKAFSDAQKAGKPILIGIHASWCPTCAAQRPILSELMTDRKFNELVYLVIDYNSQKDLVRQFGAQRQSTLIAFKGSNERSRSVGDTNRDSIAALLNKTL